jgi:hypothetical protein
MIATAPPPSKTSCPLNFPHSCPSFQLLDHPRPYLFGLRNQKVFLAAYAPPLIANTSATVIATFAYVNRLRILENIFYSFPGPSQTAL